MWDRREFAAALPLERLRSSHQATVLGSLWHLGTPILSVGVYYLIFGVILGVTRGIDNFVVFLTVGVFSLGLTTRSFTTGAQAVTGNTGLMRAMRFPRALLPVSAVISHLLTFGFELLILAGVAVVTGEGISMRWIALPFIVAVHTVFNLGGAFVMCRLNDSFRDVENIIPFIMRLAMYGSGVMFDIESRTQNAPPWVKTILDWNPLAEIINLYRWVFMGWPFDHGGVFRLIIVSFGLLIGGFRFFKAAEFRYGRG